MCASRVLVGGIAALLLVVSACGGDDSGGLSDDEQSYADALTVALQNSKDNFGVDEDEGLCMAEAVLQVIGVAPFEAADVAAEDIDDFDAPGKLLGEEAVDDADATAIARAWGECADLPKTFAQAGAKEFKLDEAGVACLEDGLRERDILTDVIAATFTSVGGEPEPETLQDLVGLVSGCSTGEGGEGGLLVDSIAQSLVAGAGLTEQEATCVGQHAVDRVGADRLVELTANGVVYENAPPDVQDELSAALVVAAEACNVPIDRLGL